MKRGAVRTMSMLCLLALVVPDMFSQGVSWESAVTTRAASKPRTERYYYMPKMMKTVSEEDGQTAIIRLDREVMVMVDPVKKEYWQLTFAEMEQFAKGAGAAMDAQMEEMRKQLAELPEEQRKMAEKMLGERMGSGPAGKIDVKNTGESRSINGFSCTKYLVTMGEAGTTAVWATKDVKEFEVMKKDMEELSKKMEAMLPPSMKGTQGTLSGVEGFPIQTEREDGWKSTVTKIEQRSTPAGEFEVPAGYKKVSAPMMGGGDVDN